METNNTNVVQMKPGTPVSIGRKANFSETSAAPIVEKPKEVKHPEVSVSEKDVQKTNVEVAEQKEIDERPKNVVELSEKVAQHAKENGVDEAFELLAKSKLAEKPEEEKVEKKIEEKAMQKGEEKVEMHDVSVESQFEFLQKRVDQLSAENSEFKRKIEDLEVNNKLAIMTIYEQAQILKQLIDKEEDEKKRIPLLAALVEIMGKLIVAMMAGPEEAEKVGEPIGAPIVENKAA